MLEDGAAAAVAPEAPVEQGQDQDMQVTQEAQEMQIVHETPLRTDIVHEEKPTLADEPPSKRLKVEDNSLNDNSVGSQEPSQVSLISADANETASLPSDQNSANEPNKGAISWLLTATPNEPKPAGSVPLTGEAHEALKRERLAFIQQLKVGDILDVKCRRYRRWYAAKVLKVGEKKIKIHFQGFKSAQDTSYAVDDYMYLAPEGSYTLPCTQTQGGKGHREPSAIDADLGGTFEKDMEIAAALAAKKKAERLAKPKVPKKKPEPETNSEEIQPAAKQPKAEAPIEKPKQKKSAPKTAQPAQPVQVAPQDPFEALSIRRDELPLWLTSTNTMKPTGDFEGDLSREQEVCLACLEVEDEDMSEYVLCDGGCLGSYHQSCVGISSEDLLSDKWYCENCTRREHECLICHRYGTVGEAVVKCSMEDCGKYYHLECVLLHPRTFVNTKNKTFRCPRHACSNCHALKGSEGFMRCLHCSTAYHPKCIPPSCNYNNVAMVCGKHRTAKLPSIPDFYGPNKIVFDGTFKFPELFLPKEAPSEEKPAAPFHFRLPMVLIDESNAKPPRYQKIKRNQYDKYNRPKVDLSDLPRCQCKEKCDDECINRISFVECIGGLRPDGKEEKYSNCPVGANCGNRALQENKVPKTQIFKTLNGRGFGLKVVEPVKAGQLVIEYIGEVISEGEKRLRLIEHAEQNPGDPNYYIMQLDKNAFLDGRFKGSDSRYINHSCDPNCQLLKWDVAEHKRIAITAVRDIEAGEELSYDYQMETNSTDSFKCQCGAVKCRGTMAPNNLNWEAHAKMEQAELAAKNADKKKTKKKRKRTVKSEPAAEPVKPEAVADVDGVKQEYSMASPTPVGGETSEEASSASSTAASPESGASEVKSESLKALLNPMVPPATNLTQAPVPDQAANAVEATVAAVTTSEPTVVIPQAAIPGPQ
ncbi:unnamed protein product [Aphanomyces euteiches]|uniref:Histone-lysine N-methyltransferase n=1 Tax=Aphanomyces euteiches TaxID=100861 RepID=A0A6G0XW71_9STRA|nr:hypothetical protein Ae201684_001155 [Aphanomyces euteiches]KAH9099758.1 hypothetical protein Ae201684P_018768 [Aphanomyces euteiches]KAH9144033.1 hypothetical protein AeRB84_011996 [Aphanomyces euteiches]